MLGEALLKRWDAAVFLGFDVWEFAARSLGRAYGRLFLRAVVLRHPWRAWTGLLAYRTRVRPARQWHLAPVDVGSDASWRLELAEGDWVVGLGFCQKPLEPACPSGRFNHRCQVMAQPAGAELPSACRFCQIREVAVHALPAGATVHIMTSAVDIAQDLLLPALRESRPLRVALSVCPYSVAPISLAMIVCGLRGWVWSYGQGDCRDYPAWSLADDGEKGEQTFLPPPAHRRLLAWLDGIAELRSKSGWSRPRQFMETGHFYVPAQ